MPNPSRWRFGHFEVDALEHQLRRDGEIVPVTRKSFALLATLLSRPGKLFTKAELFETVWAGTVVSDAALSRAIRELRVGLGDDAAAPRYIATAHGLGFRFVAAVERDTDVAGGVAAAAAVADAPADGLVARDRELALLDDAFDAAGAGRRQLVFVTGEAGIGKTALVESFLARKSSDGGAWIAQGRCVDQYGDSEAFLPIVEALENLTRQVGAGPLHDVLARYAPTWLAQLPWLADPGDPPATAPAAATTPQGVLREISHALEVLAAQMPIVLWLEDLHWSDPSTLAAIAFLAGRRDPARLLLVATFRPADARASASPLHGLVLQLMQRGQAAAIALEPLDPAAVTEYLRARFGSDAALPFETLGAFIHWRTDGNALFTVAMVEDLVRRRTLAQQDGSWQLVGSVAEIGDDLPDDLRQLVHEQLDRLPDDDRRLVEAAAMAGTDFSAAAVAAALQTGVEQVEDHCAKLARSGRFMRMRTPVAWPDGTVSAGFGFLHALYWQATHERVPQSRRADWQRRIGLCQEQAHGAQCGPIAAELAMRFEAARDVERSVRYLKLAAGVALSRCAYVECISLLRRSLALLPLLPEEQRATREIDLLLPLGAALMATQGYAAGEVEATYRRALLLCDQGAGADELDRVLRGLWNVAFLRADLVRARELAQQLLGRATAAGDARLASDAHAKLGQTCIHQGDLTAARHHLERALDTTGADDSRQREAPRVAIYLAWALWYTGHPELALHRAQAAIDMAAGADSPHSSAFAIGYSCQLQVLCGDRSRELALAVQLHALSIEHEFGFWRALAEFNQGRVLAAEGDAEGGIAAMCRAIDNIRAAGGLVGVPYLLCLLAEARLADGRLDGARDALAEANRLVGANGNALYAAEGLRLEGEVALAEGGKESRRHAESKFVAARDLARQQGAIALEQRAAASLARRRPVAAATTRKR